MQVSTTTKDKHGTTCGQHLFIKISYLAQCVVYPINQLHAPAQKLVIRHTVARPSNQHSIQTKAFGVAKFTIVKVGIEDHLADGGNFGIANGKLLAKRLEAAIVSAMAKSSTLEHIEGNSIRK